MKRVLATGFGIVLATGLAMATPSVSPEDVVARHYVAEEAGDMLGNWKDWHPEATQKITIKYGLGQPDDEFTITMSDLSKPLDIKDIPSTEKDYAERARDSREITVEDAEGEVTITASQKIHYTWRGYDGTMVQTDAFRMTTILGQPKIRSLTTTLDYR